MSSYEIFSVLGIEIEYMLVDCDTLSIQPVSDVIIQKLAGELTNEIDLGEIMMSNELVLHVIELKNNGPKSPHSPIAYHFQKALQDLKPLLAEHNLQLLPTGAHPWMNPGQETKRWPHGNKAIYQQYDSIFNCEGHGWANLQSMHINLPFANDTEFYQLHNTVRILLPLLPALAASTPFLDGKITGLLDSRLAFYEKNQHRIPEISGRIIPEFICSQEQYEREILQPMYRAIHPYDPDKILQYEWLNSRAAIPKFESMALEIRILDTQECVNADIAIAQFVHAILKSWLSQSHDHLEKACETRQLKAIYDQTLLHGMATPIDDLDILQHWQLPKRSMSAQNALGLLIERVSSELTMEQQQIFEHILNQGNLSERLLRACGNGFNPSSLKSVYRQLGDCLDNNQLFKAS